jgi:hypothetical protein
MDFTATLGVIVSIVGLLQVLALCLIAYLVQRNRADNTALELRLVEKLSKILESYVSAKQFNDHVVWSAQQFEGMSKFMNEEFKRLRDWKHDFADPAIRGTGARLADVKEDVNGMKKDVEKLKEDK